MTSRIWRVKNGPDRGFALTELLIVVIIMGVLATIALGLFLSQRAKAEDAKTRNDVAVMGKELAAYWTEENETPSVLIAEDLPTAGNRTWHVLPHDVSAVTAANFEDSVVVAVSPDVAKTGTKGVDWDYTGTNRRDWCFWAYNDNGKEKGFWLSATTTIRGMEGSQDNPCAP
ncbi:MAG: type II secretion system GspH family protein [Bifidobacteriaceae bacterium]|jgi:prepilin-type N-terminal cleavage/methylation domain-containing protein|nr:type II secretion system GspH family protein [Bifidobacteriaceae bacterium]